MDYQGQSRSNYVNFTEPDIVRQIVGYYGCRLEFVAGTGYMVEPDQRSNNGGDVNDIMAEYEHQEPGVLRILFDLGLTPKGVKFDDIPKDEDIALPHMGRAIAKYIPDDEVFIWMHNGSEGLRYLTGYAYAINNKKQLKEVNLNYIYKLAEKLTNDKEKLSMAEY